MTTLTYAFDVQLYRFTELEPFSLAASRHLPGSTFPTTIKTLPGIDNIHSPFAMQFRLKTAPRYFEGSPTRTYKCHENATSRTIIRGSAWKHYICPATISSSAAPSRCFQHRTLGRLSLLNADAENISSVTLVECRIRVPENPLRRCSKLYQHQPRHTRNKRRWLHGLAIDKNCRTWTDKSSTHEVTAKTTKELN